MRSFIEFRSKFYFSLSMYNVVYLRILRELAKMWMLAWNETMSSVLHILMIERVVLQSIYWWLSTSRDNIYVFINSHCANIFKFLIYYLLKLSFPIFWNGNSQLLSGRLHSSTWALKLGIYLCIYPRVLLSLLTH